MVKKYFPGGNSGKGFYNCFAGIKAFGEEDFRTIVLKGGPGVGKNTLMKKVADEAKERGFDVSYFYCSGDPDSLDAVKIKEKSVILVDGTAPHIIDPVFPGVDDEIVNLGVYISPDIFTKRAELKALFAKNSYEYTRCYSYLATALALVNGNRQAFGEIYDVNLMDKKITEMITPDYKRNGRQRKLFLEAVTCKGNVAFMDTVSAKNVFTVSGDGRHLFMERLNLYLDGKDRELYLDPIDTKAINHIYIPHEDKWFTTFDVSENIVDSNEFLKGESSEYVSFNKAQVEILKEKAISHLKQCKAAHDEIEKIYYKYMDFDGVNKEHEAVINRIFS